VLHAEVEQMLVAPLDDQDKAELTRLLRKLLAATETRMGQRSVADA
jgi:hypothetical protein